MTAFQSPNYTQAPNDLFDWLPDMGEAELRVTLVLVRWTFGFHRDGTKLSIRKLAEAAGLSRQGALDGAQQAQKRGTFRRLNPDGQGEAEWELVTDPLQAVGAPLHAVDTPPLSSGGQVGVKESIKERDKETNSPSKKKDLVDLYLDTQYHPARLRQAITDYFRLTPNWEAKYNRQFLEWAVEKRITPAQIKLASERWSADERFNWRGKRGPDLRLIQEHWLELTRPPDRARGPVQVVGEYEKRVRGIK
jgi:hypothetical protein